MANPHSLFTTPTRQTAAQRLPIGPTPRQRSESISARSLHPQQQHTRSPSTATTYTNTTITGRTRLPQIDDYSPSSPTASTFSGVGAVSYSGPTTSAAAAFLRPSRPGQPSGAPYPSLSAPRPLSRLSTDSRRRSGPRTLGDRLSAAYSLDSHPDEPDEFSLRRISSADGESEAHYSGVVTSTPRRSSAAAAAGMATKSREPLLPLSRKDTQDSGFGQAGVRDSLDKLFRRLSGGATEASATTTTIAGHALGPTPTGTLEKHAEEADDAQSTELSSAQKHSLSLARARVGGGEDTPTGSFTVLAHAAPHSSARGMKEQKHHPLSAVPRTDERGRLVRKYAVHPSRNAFFLRGRLLTGGDAPWAFISSLALMFGLAGTWFGTTCVWWAKNESVAVAVVGGYMCMLTVSTMLGTAMRDPGILPRELDPDPPCSSVASGESTSRVPMPRDLKVRKGMVRVKYCATCRMYRPPRSSHCKMCDNCVEGCDHHCQWVNNCVGHRNYTTFFAFLISAVLTLALVVCTSAIHIYLLTARDRLSFVHALNAGAGSAVVFSVGVVVIWPITALALYHVRLLLLNVTTIEQIRTQAHKTLVPGPPPPNPFTHGGWHRNLVNVLCRPEGYSWLDPTAVVTDDRREVNPGLQQEAAGATTTTSTTAAGGV